MQLEQQENFTIHGPQLEILGEVETKLPAPAKKRGTASIVLAALALHAVQRAGQGSDGDLLNGQEHTEIDLGAQLFAGGDDIAPPHQKADARARDVEALAQREELHRAFLGTRRVEDAAAVGTVKDNIAVGVVMYQQNVVLTAEIDDFCVELRRADAAHRVGGQADQHELGPAGHVLRDGGNVGQEVVLLRQLVVPRLGTAQLGAGHKDGVAGVGQQHQIAVVAERQAQMADTVLAAGEAHDLVGGDGVHVKAALVVAADSLQHLGQVAQAVLPVFVVLCGVDERLLQVVRRCKIRRADA